MKGLLLVLMLLPAYIGAQTYKPIDNKSSITIDNTTFEGITTRNNSVYIYRISKDGNKYKSLMGYLTKDTYQGRKVYSDKEKIKYWYHTINHKTGYPKRNYLQK